MKLIEPSNFHVIDEPFDAIDEVRHRSLEMDADDEAVYFCNISDIIEKLKLWKQRMPRVLPFYGMLIVCTSLECDRNVIFTFTINRFNGSSNWIVGSGVFFVEN